MLRLEAVLGSMKMTNSSVECRHSAVLNLVLADEDIVSSLSEFLEGNLFAY